MTDFCLIKQSILLWRRQSKAKIRGARKESSREKNDVLQMTDEFITLESIEKAFKKEIKKFRIASGKNYS